MDTRPSLCRFKRMAGKGNLIPVYREFPADGETPVSVYLKIRDKSYSYLLESGDRGKRWGRYSYIGYSPLMTVLLRDEELEIRGKKNGKISTSGTSLMALLRHLTGRFRPVTVRDLPPFQGGLVGYLNYDLIRKWERLPRLSRAKPDMPELLFTASKRLIIFDHLTHRIKVLTFAYLGEDDDSVKAYERACEGLDEMMEDLRLPLSSSEGNPITLSSLDSNFTREAFENTVMKAKKYIVSGDVIQVVLSQRFSGEFSGDDFLLYRNLRRINPSPYMFYLNFGQMKLIGASPEILVRLKGGRIELRPIAGTGPRGRTPEEDRKLQRDLMTDPKECAEHIMLVDLARNDTGKVAVPGSVKVPRLMEVERYSHVMHLVSRVEGRLKPDLDQFDLFMSAFPAGTVTGAPKVRAMEIISELEPSMRGPYGGAVGYFGFNGNMDFCITIRTMTIMKNRLSVQVGAGIVYDSRPETEYEETLKKAAAIFKAIERTTGNDFDARQL